MTPPDEIDLSPLRAAIARLGEGLVRYRADESDEQIRDGLIQRFEFTYELSVSFLRRYLLLAAIDAAVLEPFDYPSLVREGNRLGLLRGEWPEWRRYRHMRARSSHTYAQETALQVVAAIPDFLEEARHLLHQLETRS